MREEPGEAKEALRRRLIATRRGLPPTTRQEWSRAICRQVCESVAFDRATHVVAYVPSGAEVDPSEAAEVALRTGRGLYYPATNGQLELRRTATVSPRATDTGADGDVLILNDPQVLFLVPGVGFDETADRLGRGRGWYDRALARFDRAPRWGLAFDLQVVPHLPVDSWDVPMDVVVTERRRIESRRSLELPEGTA